MNGSDAEGRSRWLTWARRPAGAPQGAAGGAGGESPGYGEDQARQLPVVGRGQAERAPEAPYASIPADRPAVCQEMTNPEMTAHSREAMEALEVLQAVWSAWAGWAGWRGRAGEEEREAPGR